MRVSSDFKTEPVFSSRAAHVKCDHLLVSLSQSCRSEGSHYVVGFWRRIGRSPSGAHVR